VDERLCPRSGGRLFFLDARGGRRLQAIGSEPALEHLLVEGTRLIFAVEFDSKCMRVGCLPGAKEVPIAAASSTEKVGTRLHPCEPSFSLFRIASFPIVKIAVSLSVKQ